MSRTVSLEDLIPPEVKTQKKILLISLKTLYLQIGKLIESIEKAESQKELLHNMSQAAKKIQKVCENG